MFAVIIPGNTKYILHVIREFNRACDCLTGECNQTSIGGPLLLWDGGYSTARRRSFLFGTLTTVAALQEADHLVIDGNQHDASLMRLPRSSNIAEGWHHGFNIMLSCNHPTIWKFMEALTKEHNLIRMQLGRMRQLEEPERRAAKWIRYDDRVQKLCDSFNRQTNVVNFLKKFANVC